MDDADPAAIEAMVGATATALESIIYYAPGDPMPRFTWSFLPDGGVALVPLEAPAVDGQA